MTLNEIEKMSKTYHRLPKDTIGNELYIASKKLSALYRTAKNGDDFKPNDLKEVMALLRKVGLSASEHPID